MFKNFPIKTTSAVAVIFLLSGFTYGASPEHVEPVLKLLSDTAQSQIAQAGFFFTVSAWLHAGRVKKEIRENFSLLTNAIDKVADAFREDLKLQSARLDNLASRVQSLEDTHTNKGE